MSQLTTRESDGSRLAKSNKIQLPQALIDVAEASWQAGGKAQVVGGFDSEREAKGLFSKLRTRLNLSGRGLRASAPFKDEQDGTYAVEFKVLPKRDVSKKS